MQILALVVVSTILLNDFVSAIDNCTGATSCNDCVSRTQNNTGCNWCIETSICSVYDEIWTVSDACSLSMVRRNNCWVNWQALLIAVCVIGGILLVIVISCACYCCCRCVQWRRRRAHRRFEAEQYEQQRRQNEIDKEHERRRAEREAERGAIRDKYGFANPAFERM